MRRRAARRTIVIAIVPALFATSVAAVACSALVGVEDVTLARADGAISGDEVVVDDDGGIMTDAFVLPEASVQVAAGFLHTCARTGGRVRCWGDNSNGQLGDGIAFDAAPPQEAKVPQDVVDISDAVAVAAGNSHSCVVRRSGKVSCWGMNLFGQLGDATTNDSSSPVDVIGISNAVAVACGSTFTCALLATGLVSCWGSNSSGQLGDGTTIDRPTAASVLQLTGALGVAAAMSHACAVVTGGFVRCWGTNDDGQLGNGTTTSSFVPTQVGSLSGFVQVAAASRFTCARQASGQVNCWGSNALGELGTGSPNTAPNPSPAVTTVTDAIVIATGYQHGCAARRTGEVVCWGAAGSGQVGSGSVAEDASIPRPTMVIGVSGALDLSSGGDHSCASTTSGSVLCWGDNSFGELGNGTEATAYAAVPTRGYP